MHKVICNNYDENKAIIRFRLEEAKALSRYQQPTSKEIQNLDKNIELCYRHCPIKINQKTKEERIVNPIKLQFSYFDPLTDDFSKLNFRQRDE